ncbi:hypothetical protein Tco_0051125 [Tanacetum coccineum]
MRQSYPNPLALLAHTYNLSPSYNSQRSQYNPHPSEYPPYQSYQHIIPSPQQKIIPLPPQQSYEPPVVTQQPPAPSTQSGFVVPSFLPTKDPIASLNKAMTTQATIQDGRVTVQNVQGRQFQEHVDAFDSDYDEEPTASAIFMARLSPVGSVNRADVSPTYDSDILSKVPHYDTYHETDMLNPVVQETRYFEHLVSNIDSCDELTSNNNVISYAEYMVTIENDAAQTDISSSTVTYTSVYTDSEPWRFYAGSDKEPSDVGSPGVNIYGYNGLPMHPVAPPSPDFVPGPEHLPSPDYVPGPEHPPSLVYVPEPEYPEYLVPSRDEAPIEDQPLPDDASPTALSPGYVADSDPEEDPEEDHADYPADGEDGDDESSDDDDDDDDADDEDEASEGRLFCYTCYDIPEADLPPRKRLCLTAPSLRYEAGESSAAGAARLTGPSLEADLRRDRVREIGYGITDTWDEIVEAMQEIAPTTLEEVNQRVTKFATTVRQDTDEFYVRFEDAQDDQAFLRARVNTLFRDRSYHCHTAMLLDREATYARRAWAGSEDKSAAIEAHVRTLEAQVATLIAQTSSLQTQLTTTLGRIQTLEARDLEPQDEPAKAGSSC